MIRTSIASLSQKKQFSMMRRQLLNGFSDCLIKTSMWTIQGRYLIRGFRPVY